MADTTPNIGFTIHNEDEFMNIEHLNDYARTTDIWGGGLQQRIAELQAENEALRSELANKVNIDTDLTWVPVEFKNSWTGTLSCLKDSSGTVFFNGAFVRVSGPAPSPGEEICILPQGYRPNKTLTFIIIAPVSTGTSTAVIGNILANGIVRFTTNALPSGWVNNNSSGIDTVYKAA